MKNSRLILSVLILFLSTQCFSDNKNTDLKNQISTFLNNYSNTMADKGYRSEYKLGNIDPHLTLNACTTPLNISFNKDPTEQNNITILAQCETPKPWKLYIRAQYDIYSSIITAKETISKGTTITQSMLESQEKITNKGRHTGFSNTNSVVGMIAKRTIRNNMVISANQLRAPSLIKRGDSVIITAANSTIAVSMNGTALMDGMLGQQISIKNSQSKRTIKGRVTDRGHVLITL
jgi:flagella basal body P-ring formation protein FlgA